MGVTVSLYLLAAQLYVGGTLLLSAAAKLKDMTAFVGGIAGFGLMPGQFLRPVAWLTVGAEVVIGVMLLSGMAPLLSGVAAVGLFFIFLGAVVTTLARGQGVPCHCFGATADRVGTMTVVRLVVLIIVSAGIATSATSAATVGELIGGGAGELRGLVSAASLAASGIVLTVLLGPLGTLWRYLAKSRRRGVGGDEKQRRLDVWRQRVAAAGLDGQESGI